MPEHRLNELDADLRQLLALEPSPEFGARVRAGIAGESMTRWRRPWVPLSIACGAATVAVVTLGVVSRPAVEPGPPAPAPPSAVTRSSARPVIATRSEPDASAGIRRNEGRAVRPAESATPPVEVIVDARQRAGIDLAIALAAAGTVLPLAPAADLPTPSDIVVEPLTVPLLTVDPPAKPAGAQKE